MYCYPANVRTETEKAKNRVARGMCFVCESGNPALTYPTPAAIEDRKYCCRCWGGQIFRALNEARGPIQMELQAPSTGYTFTRSIRTVLELDSTREWATCLIPGTEHTMTLPTRLLRFIETAAEEVAA